MTRMSSNAKQPRQTAAVLRRWCWASWTSSQWTASDHYFFYILWHSTAHKKKTMCQIASPRTVLGSLVGCCTKDGYIYILLGGSAGVVGYWNAQC
jgi:hypothetical protein